MTNPFKYKTGNICSDEADRLNGMILVDRPEAGDWVCSYSKMGEIYITVKCNSDSSSRVSRYLNRRNIDFQQDFFTFED
jgi:hypothetical protein